MKKIVFTDTSGFEQGNPDTNFLKNLVYNGGDEFWDGGSGQAAVEFYSNNMRVSELFISGLEEYGFMIDYEYKDDRPLVLIEGEHTGQTVEVYVGGNPMPCFREYLVSKDTAWKAIEHFMKTGERLEELTWQDHQMPELAEY